MKSVYLTIGLGVEKTQREEIIRIKEEIRSTIPQYSKFLIDDLINLGTGTKAKEYAFSTAAYIKYDHGQFPNEIELINDLKDMIKIYENYIKIKTGASPISYDSGGRTKKSKDLVREKIEYLSYNNLISHIFTFIKGKGFLWRG